MTNQLQSTRNGEQKWRECVVRCINHNPWDREADSVNVAVHYISMRNEFDELIEGSNQFEKRIRHRDFDL